MYSDIDLSLTKTPNNDIPLLRDNAAIRTSIMNLLAFNMHDIFLNDYFGGFLKEILFENDNQIETGILRNRIEWILETYEPRIKVILVDVNYKDSSVLNIDISYTILVDDSFDKVTYIRDLNNENRL